MAPKIVFVINSLEGGGAERVLTNLANNFSQKKFNVTIVCLNHTPSAYAVSDKVQVISLLKRRSDSYFMRFYYAILTCLSLFFTLFKANPTCVISFTTTVNLWTGFNCVLLNIPFIVSERTTAIFTIDTYSKSIKWVLSLIYSKSKAVVIPAVKMKASLLNNKGIIHKWNFVTIKNPVNAFGPTSGKILNNKKFILSTGRLDYYKGFDMLIKSFSELQHSDLDLLIAGEGEERANLEHQIAEMNLTGRVKLIGFKSNLKDYYDQAEIFVLASRVEGYPNALVEAMSLGCACIATDCDFGPSEIISNYLNGILIKEDDSFALTEAMSLLLNDESLRRKLSTQAKLINSTNSLEMISNEWEDLIRNYD